MKHLFSILWLLISVSIVSFADTSLKKPASTNEAIVLMKPHDHTGTALDIMVQKDVVRTDYGQTLYQKHCASCHGVDRRGSKGGELSNKTLHTYHTISELYLEIKKGCPKAEAMDFTMLGNVKLIFIARHIKKPLVKHAIINH